MVWGRQWYGKECGMWWDVVKGGINMVLGGLCYEKNVVLGGMWYANNVVWRGQWYEKECGMGEGGLWY